MNGIYHKINLTGNYYVAQSTSSLNNFPQLDRLNDDATDQSPQLALVVEAEVEVALQRLAQVEPEAHAGRKADVRTALLRHRQSPPQAPFSPEVDTAEDRIENLRQHGGKLP